MPLRIVSSGRGQHCMVHQLRARRRPPGYSHRDLAQRTTKMDDETLIVRYYSCEDAAFAELYGRYFPRLVAFLRRSVSADQAEDLAEEVFLRVVRTKATGSSRFDPQRN